MTDTIDDNDNGIVKCYIRGEEYTFWTHAKIVRKYIKGDIKKRFPEKLIVRELNQIDFAVPEENLSIEVQATPVQGTNNYPIYSSFEQKIEKQINQNIISYGMCWFFFDSELLKAMKYAGKGMSINMVWFRNYMKEEKLKVFTVRYDGVIEEKQYSDFDFLTEVSQTCPIAAKSDDMTLNENKLKIYASVVKGYGFTQGEIDKFESDFENFSESDKRKTNFLKRCIDERAKLYGNILQAIGYLSAINDILGLKNYDHTAKYSASILEIFDGEGRTHNSVTRFVDRSNVCQYFPGYMRNKETWGKLKNHSLSSRQFERIVKNGIGNYFYYEDKKDIVTESEQIDDKGINVTIESKDRIISVNIKDKTKQGNIEDSWS